VLDGEEGGRGEGRGIESMKGEQEKGDGGEGGGRGGREGQVEKRGKRGEGTRGELGEGGVKREGFGVGGKPDITTLSARAPEQVETSYLEN